MPTINETLLSYVNPFIRSNSGLSDHRARLEAIDRLIERSYQAHKKSSCRDTKDAPPEEDNVTIPVVGPQLSTLAAQLAKIFLRTDPPIQMFSAPAAAEIANQYNILYSRYSRKFQWRRNLLLVIRDAVNYNFCAAEVRWRARAVRTITQQINAQTGLNKITNAYEEGESIKHLHPYNVIWDGSVPLNEVSYRGAYAGYVERYTRIALAQFCKDEGIELTQEDWKEISAHQETADGLSYFVPEINPVVHNDKVELSHDDIFDGKTAKSQNKTSTVQYNLTTLYIRAIPMDFDIVQEGATEINIIKLYIIGSSKILKYEVLDNAHNLFPIIFGQTDESPLGLNSFTSAEELAPIQNTATKLYNAELASTRRLISDRAIYDSDLISAKEVNNPSPTAKIPLKRSKHGSFALNQAYFAIPYEDRALGVRLNFANSLLGFASQITSANQTMQGQFVRGNKTAGEFNTTMSMAGDRLTQSAIFIDDQFFAPLRTILLSDTLQYQSNVKVFDKESGQFIEVDMTTLRDTPLDFDIAAGLIPAEELASTEFFQVLLQTLMSRPDLNMEFRTTEALCYLAEMKGVKYLRRFQRSQQEIQQMQQAQLQQSLAMEQGKAQISAQADAQKSQQGPQQ